MGDLCGKPEWEEDQRELPKAFSKKQIQRRASVRVVLPDDVRKVVQVQAWWRGTLLRRTLLAAALRAWVIQSWWRRVLWQRVQLLRRDCLAVYGVRELGAVRLQAWFRKWRCRRSYCQTRGATSLPPGPEACHPAQPSDALRLPCRGPSRELEFRVEILSI